VYVRQNHYTAIHNTNTQVRRLFYPEIPDEIFTNPDMRINGLLADYKEPLTWHDKKLSTLLKEARRQQAEIVIISLKNVTVNMERLKGSIIGRLTNSKIVKQVWLELSNGSVEKYIATM
jgi:hypothetical protein